MSGKNNASLNSSESALVSTLNTLLDRLQLTITLQNPLDLIPSVLLAILESILESRLPISADIRESRNPSHKVLAMKIFLGVLENDVLQMDAGLSEVDPRKLAAGRWEEVIFVGELLCWLGKQKGLLPPETVEILRDVEDSSVIPKLHSAHTRIHSPSTRSTVTSSANTDLSMQSANTNSDTTMMTGSYSSSGSPSVASTNPRHQPGCIHELEDIYLIPNDDALGPDESEDISLIGSSDSCDCSSGTLASRSQQISIRHAGWIDAVDDSLELELFEASKRNRSSGSRSQLRFHNDVVSNFIYGF